MEPQKQFALHLSRPPHGWRERFMVLRFRIAGFRVVRTYLGEGEPHRMRKNSTRQTEQVERREFSRM